MLARGAAFVAVFVFPCVGISQEDAKAVEKQKSAAESALKSAGVAKPNHAEAGDLLVYSTLPEPKTKAVAEAAQRTFTFAKKTLNFDDKETYWPGKLTVYVLPDWRTYSDVLRPL